VVLPAGADDGGSASNTTEGTVKVPALSGAVHEKDALTVLPAVAPGTLLDPEIVT
jgi:hypothetical protein